MKTWRHGFRPKWFGSPAVGFGATPTTSGTLTGKKNEPFGTLPLLTDRLDYAVGREL
jgi:hypothetical protein